MTLLTDKYLETYISSLNSDIAVDFSKLEEKEWTTENSKFYTAVSVISSVKIEGEKLEIDSYLKHKLQNVEYLPHLTEKPNDLYTAYEFAKDHPLTIKNFLHTHSLAANHLLPASQRGRVRTRNMVIMDHQTGKIQYEATEASMVKKEFEQFWNELDEILNQTLTIQEVFYYASLIHLVFVKIHPFNDGNGRTARLLEKWFLASKLGKKAWFIRSEQYYYQNLKDYYQNLQQVGMFYSELTYEKGTPFLMMLPKSLVI